MSIRRVHSISAGLKRNWQDYYNSFYKGIRHIVGAASTTIINPNDYYYYYYYYYYY